VDVLRSLPGIIISQPESDKFWGNFQIRELTGNLFTSIFVIWKPDHEIKLILDIAGQPMKEQKKILEIIRKHKQTIMKQVAVNLATL